MKQIIITPDTMSEAFAEIGQYIDKHSGESLIVEVRKYDPQKEISYNQMKYIHCDAGPIKLFAEFQGCSNLESELQLKRECGEHLFIKELTGQTWVELCELRGKSYFECKNTLCRLLALPQDMIKVDGKRACPMCKTLEPRVVMILSKTELTTKQTNEWIENMYTFLTSQNINVQMPNRDWRKEQ